MAIACKAPIYSTIYKTRMTNVAYKQANVMHLTYSKQAQEAPEQAQSLAHAGAVLSLQQHAGERALRIHIAHVCKPLQVQLLLLPRGTPQGLASVP